MTDDTKLPAVQDAAPPRGVGSLTLAKLEGAGKDGAALSGPVENHPGLRALEEGVQDLVAKLTQQVQELADKAGVKADVLVKVVLNPK